MNLINLNYGYLIDLETSNIYKPIQTDEEGNIRYKLLTKKEKDSPRLDEWGRIEGTCL